MNCSHCNEDVSRYSPVRHNGAWRHRSSRKEALRIAAGNKLAVLRKQKEAQK